MWPSRQRAQFITVCSATSFYRWEDHYHMSPSLLFFKPDKLNLSFFMPHSFIHPSLLFWATPPLSYTRDSPGQCVHLLSAQLPVSLGWSLLRKIQRQQKQNGSRTWRIGDVLCWVVVCSLGCWNGTQMRPWIIQLVLPLQDTCWVISGSGSLLSYTSSQKLM